MVHRRKSTLPLLLGLMAVLAFLLFIISPGSPSVFTSRYGKQHRLPKVRFSNAAIQHHKLNNLTATSNPVKMKERVLILTPMARFFDGYWKNLLRLNYPRELVDLGFIVPKGKEGSMVLERLREAVKEVQSGSRKLQFNSVTILCQDTDSPASQEEKDRHALSTQKGRREAMSRARNSLLFTALGPATSWVLWLDADIVETPPSLIQDLALHDKPIIVANCYQRYVDDTGEQKIREYDFNSWHDSPAALQLADSLGEDEVVFEGEAFQEGCTTNSRIPRNGYLQGSDGLRIQCGWQPAHGDDAGWRWGNCSAREGGSAPRRGQFPPLCILQPHRERGLCKDGATTRLPALGPSQLPCLPPQRLNTLPVPSRSLSFLNHADPCVHRRWLVPGKVHHVARHGTYAASEADPACGEEQVPGCVGV